MKLRKIVDLKLYQVSQKYVYLVRIARYEKNDLYKNCWILRLFALERPTRYSADARQEWGLLVAGLL